MRSSMFTVAKPTPPRETLGNADQQVPKEGTRPLVTISLSTQVTHTGQKRDCPHRFPAAHPPGHTPRYIRPKAFSPKSAQAPCWELPEEHRNARLTPLQQLPKRRAAEMKQLASRTEVLLRPPPWSPHWRQRELGKAGN